MLTKAISYLITLLPLAAKALNPNCAPGGNFDMSPWELQLPTGSKGNPDTEFTSQLEGCYGYQDAKHLYFFTESGDGALVMKVPGSPASSGCVTTPHSKHCRTELREINPPNWNPKASTNRLTVTLKATMPDNSQYGTVIGQVHIDDSISESPVCELFYSSSGDLYVGVEQTRAGGNEKVLKIGSVPVGTLFSYEMAYENSTLSVSINGGPEKMLDASGLDVPLSYFKVGNYNQGSDPSTVHFFAISVEH